MLNYNRDRIMNNAGRVLLGFAVGAAAGAVAGILLAPDEGKNTRKLIADKSNQFAGNVNHSLKAGMDKVNSFSESAFTLINSYKEKFQGSSESSQNVPVQNESY
jgi:gas vesicle protein